MDIVVINGGSSSGKSTIARALQDMMSTPWLVLSVDDLVDALPRRVIDFGDDGSVLLTDEFRAAEQAWNRGLAAIAAAGIGVIVDDVFLGGAASQDRLRAAFASLRVLWVGARCAPEVAEQRESMRGDRPAGMARSQAEVVHTGVAYDLEVDTERLSPIDCATVIASRLR